MAADIPLRPSDSTSPLAVEGADQQNAGRLAPGRDPPPIQDYELLRCIGQGSYGEVWLARNVFGEHRAVKIVYRRDFTDDRPFHREYEGIKKFEPISRSHPSQLAILHAGKNDDAGCFYYVMELADDAVTWEQKVREGEGPRPSPPFAAFSPANYVPRTLRFELDQRGRLPVGLCIEIGLSLTTALAHLHKYGLVHRDVKPSNIIFVKGVPKLADIGLVTAVGDTKSIVGTEGYLAPEGPGSPRADIFSLGKVLYEIGMGRDRRHFPDLPLDWQDNPDRAHLLELNEVLLKACARDAGQRYQSAEEMQADLALLQSGQSIQRLRVVERRLAILTKTSLFVSALMVIAATAYFFAVSQTRRAETARRHSEHLLYAADMNLAQQALEAGNIVRATMLLEAHRPGSKSEIRPAATARQRGENPKSEIAEDLRGFEWYYLKNLCRSDDAHTFLGHTQTVQCVAMSPDGKLLASCGDDETVRLWDFVSKTNLAVLTAHAGPVNAVAFSPDGTRLASGGADKKVKLWDLATRAVVADLTDHKAAVTSVAFSSDGKWLAAGTEGATAKVWDLATGAEVGEFEGPEGEADLVAFSPDGKLLATAGATFGVKLWDLASGQPLPLLYDQAGATWGIAFSPDSKVLVTTRSDGVVLWDVQSRGVLGKLKGHEREPGAVVFSRDGKMLATGSDDTTVRLWDIEARRPVRIFKGHSGRIFSVAFSPDGRKLVSGSADHTVKQWDLAAKQDPDALLGHADSVLCVAFSPDDQLLASASLDGTVKLWNVPSGANLATLNGHGAAVTGVAFSADGTILVSCGVDKTIRLWNVQTREQIAVLSSGRRIGCLALSPDDRTLATGSGWVDDADVASEILFWDLQSRQLLTNLVDGVGVIRVLQFSGDGKFLVVGQARDTVTKLVDVAAKRVIFSSTNLERFVALSPDGRTLASPTLADLERIALFDTSTHRILGSVESPSGATRYLAFSPDGKTLAVAYANARIKLCHLASGRDVTTLEGHDGFCWSLVFSHDGQTLASAASDRTLRLWRAPTNEVAVARQTTGQVR